MKRQENAYVTIRFHTERLVCRWSDSWYIVIGLCAQSAVAMDGYHFSARLVEGETRRRRGEEEKRRRGEEERRRRGGGEDEMRRRRDEETRRDKK